MEHIADLSSEGNGNNTNFSGGEFEQKVLQSVDTSLEDAIDVEPFVAINTCSTQDVVGGLPTSMPGNASIEGLDDQRHSHRFLAGEKGHALEGTTETDNVVEDHGTSSCAPPDQMNLQEQGGNKLSSELLEDDSSVKMGPANSLHQGETLVEKSTSVSVTCTSKVMDVEKVNSQLVFDMSTDSSVETHDSGIEVGTSEEHELIKATAQDSVPDFPEKASDDAQSVDLKVFISDSVVCNEENEDTEHMEASETECLVSQGFLQELHSKLPKEIKEEGNVGLTNCAQDDNGASAPLIDNIEVAKAFMEEDALKSVEESSNSFIQSEFKSLADAGESTKALMGDDGDVGNEIVLDQRCLTRVDADTNGKDLVTIGNVISTVEVSKVSLGESIEEDYASYDDEASKVCLSTTSSIRSQIEMMEEETLKAKCSVDDANIKVNDEGGPLSQTEDAAASSECQHHGLTVDKDGGSSLDSTAGTGIQRSDEGAPIGDEEASSTGCEDTASSPACVQPVTHQRKKINIHHQFVREIVKIQHDRELYDREQAERQFQAQQAAGLPQIGSKSSDIKEQRSISSEMRDVRAEANNQKGLKEVGALKQVKDLQQKQSARNKQPSLIQLRNGPSVHQWSSPNEQSQAAGAKEQGKIGRGKQQLRSMSLYRPPVVRESLAAEQRTQGDLETSYHQSGAYAINDSPDSSTSSFSESHAPLAGSPHLISEEGPLKAVRSSSEERLGDNIESQAEQSTHGMGIKVTFDTEKKQRHIQLSGEPDSISGGEQASPAASHSSSGYGVSKGRKFNPSLSHSFHDLKLSRQQTGFAETPSKGNDRHFSQPTRSVNPSQRHPFQDSRYASASRQIDHGETPSKGNHQPYRQGSRQQIAHGETPSKGNDRHFTQGARSVNPSLGHPFQDSRFSSGSRQIDHGAAPSKSNYDRHFTQAASSVNSLHQDSQFSPGNRQMDHGDTHPKASDRNFTQGARSGSLQSSEPFQNRGRGGKLSEKTTERKSNFFERADNSANLHSTSFWSQKSPPSLMRQGSDSSRHSDRYAGTPSPSSQSFDTPSFQRAPSREGELFGSASLAAPNVRSEDYDKSAMNTHANFQQQQFNTPRSRDFRGSHRYVISNESREGKREPQHRNSTKEYSSPFQAMMKEMSRPQPVFSSPVQRSADVNLESKGFGASWHAKDHTQMHSEDTSQESLRRSQSDASRKGYTQSQQAQATPSPSRESLFGTMPMQEKWGDIVDDLTDSYDYLQIKSEGDRDTQLGSFSYGASNMGTSDARVPKPASREPKQDRGMPKYSSDLAREHSTYETPSRKSVFERLGPQNNFQESILGPPPKMLDNRGVLKASPDALLSNVPTMSTYHSFDSGFYGSQWAPQPQLPSMQHESADSIVDEGREVVIQAYTEVKQRRSKRELYVPRRGS